MGEGFFEGKLLGLLSVAGAALVLLLFGVFRRVVEVLTTGWKLTEAEPSPAPTPAPR